MKTLKKSRDFSAARCPILPLLNKKAKKANKKLPNVVDLYKPYFNSTDDSSDVFIAVYRSFLSDRMTFGLETRVLIAMFSTFHALLKVQ